jgi:hypothetical protein
MNEKYYRNKNAKIASLKLSDTYDMIHICNGAKALLARDIKNQDYGFMGLRLVVITSPPMTSSFLSTARLRTLRSQLFVVLVLLVWKPNVVVIQAYSNGAGSCAGSTAAVGGLHLESSGGHAVVSGTLAGSGTVVTVGGTILDPSSGQATTVPIGQDLLINVESGDVGYLGVLVRLEFPNDVDTTGALVAGANTKVASVCTAPVVGITHMNANEKKSSTGTIRLDEAVDGVNLDVTVVFANGASGSVYSYTGFILNFRTAAAPTLLPTSGAVDAPVVAPGPEPPAETPGPTIRDSPAPTITLSFTPPPLAGSPTPSEVDSTPGPTIRDSPAPSKVVITPGPTISDSPAPTLSSSLTPPPLDEVFGYWILRHGGSRHVAFPGAHDCR